MGPQPHPPVPGLLHGYCSMRSALRHVDRYLSKTEEKAGQATKETKQRTNGCSLAVSGPVEVDGQGGEAEP